MIPPAVAPAGTAGWAHSGPRLATIPRTFGP
jgi:hypothetical protein